MATKTRIPIRHRNRWFIRELGTNSSSGQNQVVWGPGPFGRRTKVWQSINNDTKSDFDGGWNKAITGLDKNASYMSVVYVRRVGSATHGQFYHGCGTRANETLNMYDNKSNGNPYFRALVLRVYLQACGVYLLVLFMRITTYQI